MKSCGIFTKAIAMMALGIIMMHHCEGTDSNRVLTVEQQLEALDYILNNTIASAYEAYGISPSELENMIEVQSARSTIVDSQSEAEDGDGLMHHAFTFLMNRMLQDLFHDAHFRVEVNADAAEEYLYLDLCLAWLQGEGSGLVSTCSTDEINIGDEIVSMGGVTPDRILQSLKDTIPHENTYFLEGLSSSWLVREDFLAYFGARGEDSQSSQIELVVRRDGEILPPFFLPLVPYADVATHDELSIVRSDSMPFEGFSRYEMYKTASTAVFGLDACVFNEEFTSVLTEFWSEVHDNDIEAVVLDLRNNRGGDATVIPAFLNHLEAPPYTLFSASQRQSTSFCHDSPMFCDDEFLLQFGVDSSDEIYNVSSVVISQLFGSLVGPLPSIRFSGLFYVLTSGTTFSSANLFAMVIQDNGLGEVVGTPTGNELSFHGNVLHFDIPNTDLILYLTTAINIGEEVSNANGTDTPTDSVYPDVVISTTIEDYMLGIDPQLEWVLQQHKPVTAEPTPVSAATAGSLYQSAAGTVIVILSFAHCAFEVN